LKTLRLQLQRHILFYDLLLFLKDNPSFDNAHRNLSNDPGPIPYRAKISSSVNCDNCCGLVILLFSNAHHAGAESIASKPVSGLRSSPQAGQVGQSLLLILMPLITDFEVFIRSGHAHIGSFTSLQLIKYI
jgi:hypothetical protein